LAGEKMRLIKITGSKMSKKLIIYPFGGNARESLITILEINRIKKEWDVVGFVDDDPSTWKKDCCGIKVLGGREVFGRFPDAYVLAVLGNPNNYLKRKSIIESLGIDISRFATIIHPSVVISPDSEIGYNTLLMPNIVVSCAVKIGNHCVILPNTVISHDSKVGDYCLIGSNVTISGEVTIGSICYIGSGSKIRDNISVGQKSLVGLSSNVVSDVEEGVVVAGNPARVIRKAI
jgi:sugar O-acyltransferase (sialic acid O-acetyltransferase NeuD family)